MNSVKNRGPIEKIMDTNANRKVQIHLYKLKKLQLNYVKNQA